MHNAAHWRARAAEARRMAEEMPPGEGKDTLLGIANDYESGRQTPRFAIISAGSHPVTNPANIR